MFLCNITGFVIHVDSLHFPCVLFRKDKVLNFRERQYILGITQQIYLNFNNFGLKIS